jgi:hypothetical protein
MQSFVPGEFEQQIRDLGLIYAQVLRQFGERISIREPGT